MRPVPLPQAADCTRAAVNRIAARSNVLHPEVISLGELRAERFLRRTPARPRSAARVALKVIEGPHKGLRYKLKRKSSVLVGRSRGAKLRLKLDLHLSRHHFLVKFDGTECRLIDLESLNGTRVNDVAVCEATLKSGDIISIGRTKIRVSIGRSPNSPGSNAK